MKIYSRVGTGALAACILFSTLAPSGSARADGPDSFGIGSRGAALGGAMAGGSDDWTSAYFNPAGLAVPRKTQAGIGMVAGFDDLKPFDDVVLGYDGDGNIVRGPVGADYENVYGIVTGLAIPLTKRLSFGMTLWSPAQRVVRIMTQDPFIPAYGLYVNRAQRLTFNFAGAYRITNNFRVGLGGSALARSTFGSDIQIPAGDGSDANDSRALIILDIVPTVTPVAGVEWDVGSFMLGASYRGETDLQVVVDQTSGARVVIPLGPSLRFKSTVAINGGFVILDHFTPQQVAVGGKWAPASPVSVYFDATWMNWARYKGAYIDPNFDDIAVPPLGKVAVNWRRPPPARFRDTVVPRLGAEWRLGDKVKLRGGYSFEMTPAPLATGEANLLDVNSHVVAAGVGIAFRDPTSYVKNPIGLNLHARVRQLQTTTATKAVQYDCDDPADRPPVGYPCSGKITASGRVVSGGADFTFDF